MTYQIGQQIDLTEWCEEPITGTVIELSPHHSFIVLEISDRLQLIFNDPNPTSFGWDYLVYFGSDSLSASEVLRDLGMKNFESRKSKRVKLYTYEFKIRDCTPETFVKLSRI